MKKASTLLIGLLFITQIVFSQYQIGLIPRVSPDKGAFQKIGLTEIDIKYGSPGVKGRTVLGNLIPYDKVWRSGANNATTIEFSTDVLIEGNKLEKGKYAFFILPRQNKKWVAIFSKKNKQWGSFRYSENDDALRVEVVPTFDSEFKENLEYSISNYGFQYGSIVLAWERIRIEIHLDTEYVSQFKQTMEDRLDKSDSNTKWVVYIQGAEHLVEIKEDLDLANQWLIESEKEMANVKEWNKQFYPKGYIKGHLYWTKAKLLSISGDFETAIEYVDKMKKADEKSFFYNRENDSENIDALAEEWAANLVNK